MNKTKILAKVLTKLGLVDFYPNAGENAQKEVREAIERFKTEGRTDDNLFMWLLGEDTEDYKMPQSLATYTNKSEVKDQKCANCDYSFKKISNDTLKCSHVNGDIELRGWCRLWKPPEEDKNEK